MSSIQGFVMSKHLAIMTKPNFGMRDMSDPAFWFSVSWGEDLGRGALIILTAEKMSKAIRAADINNLGALNNHP